MHGRFFFFFFVFCYSLGASLPLCIRFLVCAGVWGRGDLCLEFGDGLKLKSTLIPLQPVTGAKNVSTAPTEPANSRPLANTLLG